MNLETVKKNRTKILAGKVSPKAIKITEMQDVLVYVSAGRLCVQAGVVPKLLVESLA